MRFQWFPTLGEALPSHTWKKIVTSLVRCHASATVLALLQSAFHLLVESHHLRKRESIQIRLHWIATGIGGFQKVHASGGDYDLHINQSFLGDRDLILLSL